MRELLKETNETWRDFSPQQKIGAAVTNLLTVSRPILSGIVSARGTDIAREWTTSDTALLAAAYTTDLEGNVARATGAQTKLGGILDPMADKIAMNTHEALLSYRGEESTVRFGMRVARDIAISALRRQTLAKTDGHANVSAGKAGKFNTALRQGVDLFATSPLGKKYPRTRTALQVASTATTVVSGVITARNLRAQTKRPKN
jgi:phosphatidylglycerophosphate synthase